MQLSPSKMYEHPLRHVWLTDGGLHRQMVPQLKRPTSSYGQPLSTHMLAGHHAINVHELGKMHLMTADLQSPPGHPP